MQSTSSVKSRARTLRIVTAIAVLGLGGCVQTTNATPSVATDRAPQTQTDGTADQSQTSTPPEALFSKFTDIPVPEQFSMDRDQSLILGGGEEWVGRLAMSTPYGADKMYDFFKREFPGFGWRELTSVRAKTSVLAYQRQGRVATVQIVAATLRGSNVIIIISPLGPNTTGSAK